jgi:organic radical activating enzyme
MHSQNHTDIPFVALENADTEKDSLLLVEWNLGKLCNYDCSYCGADLHDNISKHMPIGVFQNTINKLVEAGKLSNKKIKISFTGGEPFIHPNIIELLQFAKKQGVHRLSVTTNGTASLSTYLKALKYINWLNVSYHLEFCNKEKLMNKLIKMNKVSKQMSIHLMFLPGYTEECKELIKQFNKHNMRYVVRRIRPQANPTTVIDPNLHIYSGFIKPYSSGMAGKGYRWFPSEHSSDSYYSNEELKWLESA